MVHAHDARRAAARRAIAVDHRLQQFGEPVRRPCVRNSFIPKAGTDADDDLARPSAALSCAAGAAIERRAAPRPCANIFLAAQHLSLVEHVADAR